MTEHAVCLTSDATSLIDHALSLIGNAISLTEHALCTINQVLCAVAHLVLVRRVRHSHRYKMISLSFYVRAVALVVAFATSGCLDPKVEDKVLSEARSPSGRMKATVIERNVGLLTPTSIIVFVHPPAKLPDAGAAVIAITDGTAPTVVFIDDTKLRIRIFSGTKHNQVKEALGFTILYE